ncbi:hypothetical protein HDV05_001160, partial [Chytridiales sp. JEL 0842]
MSDSDFEETPPRRDKGKQRAASPEPAVLEQRAQEMEQRAKEQLDKDTQAAIQRSLEAPNRTGAGSSAKPKGKMVQLQIGSWLTPSSATEGRQLSSPLTPGDHKRLRTDPTELSISVGTEVRTITRRSAPCLCGTSVPGNEHDKRTNPEHILNSIWRDKSIVSHRATSRVQRLLEGIYESVDFMAFKEQFLDYLAERDEAEKKKKKRENQKARRGGAVGEEGASVVEEREEMMITRKEEMTIKSGLRSSFTAWATAHRVDEVFEKALEMTDLVRTLGKQFITFAYLSIAQNCAEFGGMLRINSKIYSVVYTAIASESHSAFSNNLQLKSVWVKFSGKLPDPVIRRLADLRGDQSLMRT